MEQIKLNYNKNYADVILNLSANIISGQVSGETAKQLSDRIGKIMLDRQSLNINRTDTSVTQSHQLDVAMQPPRIAQFSSGEFAGIVADNPNSPIELKTFHGKIVQNNKQLNKWHSRFTPLPKIRQLKSNEVYDNYLKIGAEIKALVDSELSRMNGSPALSHLVLVKMK